MARELGRVTLAEALELTALIAHKDPPRHSRYALRWLRRLLAEHERVTLEETAFAASALLALGGPSHEQAYTTLKALAERGARRSRDPTSDTANGTSS